MKTYLFQVKSMTRSYFLHSTYNFLYQELFKWQKIALCGIKSNYFVGKQLIETKNKFWIFDFQEMIPVAVWIRMPGVDISRMAGYSLSISSCQPNEKFMPVQEQRASAQNSLIDYNFSKKKPRGSSLWLSYSYIFFSPLKNLKVSANRQIILSNKVKY